MEYQYKTKGTCSVEIDLDIDNGILQDVNFVGGCNGNLKGISRLVCGMQVDDVIERLSGIKCGMKATSCPDQLTKALLEYKEGTLKKR